MIKRTGQFKRDYKREEKGHTGQRSTRIFCLS
jgi:hypothetical protein